MNPARLCCLCGCLKEETEKSDSFVYVQPAAVPQRRQAMRALLACPT
jgi:hypothetical protein